MILVTTWDSNRTIIVPHASTPIKEEAWWYKLATPVAQAVAGCCEASTHRETDDTRMFKTQNP